MTSLKQVADVRVSNVDKKWYESEAVVRLCNYTDVYYGDVLTADSQTYMEATASLQQIRNFRLAHGDTVLTKDSETPEDIGVSAYIAGSAEDFVCGYHLAIVRPLSHLVNPKYLTWFLRSEAARGQLSAAATGVTRFGLRTEALATITLDLPPLDEQRRIADFLDDQVALMDQVTELRERQLNLNREREHSALGERVDRMFSRFGGVALRRLSYGIEQGSSPMCGSSPAGSGEFGVLKVSAVRHGRFRPDENKALPHDVMADLRYIVRPGDLLVTRGSGSRDLVGDAAVVSEASPRLLLPDLIYRVRLMAGVLPEFVAAALLSPRLRANIGLVTRGAPGGTIKLRGGDILDLKVPCASAPDQALLAHAWTTAAIETKSADCAMARGMDLLHERKQALITAAVTGQFDVTTARSVL